MAIDQQGHAELRPGILQQYRQRVVIGTPAGIDPPLGLGEEQLVAVDFGAVRDDTGDGAETAGHAHAGGIHKGRQRIAEHVWIELIGLAVRVAIGARKQRPEQRCAQQWPGTEQFVDEAVLGSAERQRIEQ